MGFFDWPAPGFTALDQLMATALPDWLRLTIWAGVAAIGTMLLYKWLSPQSRIAEAKKNAREARQRLNAFDGDFADAGPLIRRQFATAFRHVGLVVPGTLLAILPLLSLLLWAETYYGHRLPPPDDPPTVRTVPEGAETRWNGAQQPAELSVFNGPTLVAAIDMTAPGGIVTKQPWWHWLAENPLGYLPDDAPVEQVWIALPERHVLPFGPDWLRSWLAVFMPVMFVVSLLMYRWANIQ